MTTALFALLALLAAAPGPDIELYDLDGRLQRTSRIRAEEGVRLVAIDFFSTACEPCRKAIPEWVRLHDAWRDKGLRVVVVALPAGDDREAERIAVRRFFGVPAVPGATPVPFPVLWDKYGVVSREWGVADKAGARLPAAFLFDRDGTLLLRADGHAAVVREVEGRLGYGSSPEPGSRSASQDR
ncbi:MAG: TlpA family protein disulfide reductase [Deltaproteobacteria bacterium]|nr:TlpA family protein disulfide reductase [Deltaproteobacteria bacterium]